ncbi:LegC family aminotransferase [Sphaerochaeta sp.]|uniref:LegC family aminotransferase n=1 Tax=Sphaerochaeta sp. TaxID=1972642 RepID=UPI003D12F457
MADFADITNFIKSLFGGSFVPLHEPRFNGNEKKYLNDCIDSTFVSSVGKYVDRLEKNFAEYTGSAHSIAAVNGTCALHTALKLVGVNYGDEVLTQPLTFIATANAVSYCGASPVFIDVDMDTLGMSPDSLSDLLHKHCSLVGDKCINRVTGKTIKACVPMHTFGHPCRIDRICEICSEWMIPVVEDAAESLGSTYKGRHTGTFGTLGVFSFNGNKIVTSGGGGLIVTDNESLAIKAKHITTTAKVPHKWEYVHDEVGFNYRMPNLNAALLCAQIEQIDGFLENKRELAKIYYEFFESNGITFFKEPDEAHSNYWLNTLVFPGIKERDSFLEYTNSNGVMTRPIWRLMNKLEMYSGCVAADLKNSEYLEERVVNIPSSARLK